MNICDLCSVKLVKLEWISISSSRAHLKPFDPNLMFYSNVACLYNFLNSLIENSIEIKMIFFVDSYKIVNEHAIAHIFIHVNVVKLLKQMIWIKMITFCCAMMKLIVKVTLKVKLMFLCQKKDIVLGVWNVGINFSLLPHTQKDHKKKTWKSCYKKMIKTCSKRYYTSNHPILFGCFRKNILHKKFFVKKICTCFGFWLILC